MGDRATFATRMQTVSPRRWAAFAAGLGLVLWSLAGGPAAAQVRPGPTTDAIDRSRGLSTQPRPPLPAPDQPAERLVPESRQRDPGTGKEIVIPPHYERSTTDRPQAPPPTGYPTPGESPARVPGR